MTTRISKYEYARLIGDRAEQLARGSPPLCDIKGLKDPIDIAKREYEVGTIPISIVRELPNGNNVVVDLIAKSRR